MILKKMKVKNFRLLKNFELNFKDELSLVIGKNNCGKTSSIIVLDKMLNSSKLFWEDINLECQKDLYKKIIGFDITKLDEVQLLETINMQLFIEYNDNDSYENIQKFMMDLNPDNNIIVLEFISLIAAKKIIELKNIMSEKNIEDFKSFSKFMSKNFGNFFETKKYSRGFDVEANKITQDRSEEIDNKDIQKVIKVAGIRADRAVSNDDRNHVLSGLTGKYFSSYKAAKDESESVFTRLEEKLEEADKELYKIYNGEKSEAGEPIDGIFSDVIDVIKTYGGAENGIDIAIESSISEKNLLSDNTNLSYRQGGDCSLPETYNGLGYLNLIGILFEIETNIQELFEQPADINLLYIEEPEAHTHPQLQYIFIRNIKSHIKAHRNKLLKEKNKQLQILITSHSSHIVSECNFDDIIYLKKNGNTVIAKSFNSLKEEYGGDEQKGFKFVKQYLTMNRSELFFTDKAICIEGDTERILMPMMMHKIDNKEKPKADLIPLLSQNISIIEVGAHSHIFIPLFEFLGIKVLIITDIDAATKNNNGRYVKSHPQEAKYTSNASIKDFFKDTCLDESNNEFEELLKKTPEDKIKNNIRIAYQIPETDGEYQASSFEDAFIALNKDFILKNKEGLCEYGALKDFSNDEIENGDYYNFALNNVKKKSAFASSLLYFDDENGEEDEKWVVPHYIEEGLLWIR
ncbi:MAG: ATP-dependent endonuclease [Dialister micraerophilus]|uniref:ATP-dependent nuclease n=1 Tax=Dialister micraerophilus TaxID=309120 RepID=UPI00254BF8D1|nr:ATP-dependent endonuclease [Dialister micraerophilus]MDK8252927.1 ATP-dependent endonuclease [Dialister micraerophilus]